jgi:hypothetical protein
MDYRSAKALRHPKAMLQPNDCRAQNELRYAESAK